VGDVKVQDQRHLVHRIRKVGTNFFIYYESTNRKLKTKYICGCRCYERLQTKTNEFTSFSYTELVLELEHLKIETRLITEMFSNVMGECEN
jgi:hypothetical protein